MIRALYSAASGMAAQEMNVDNIANNLANASTVGFKSRRAQFQDLMYQSVVQPGSASGQQTVVSAGLQLGLGTRADVHGMVFTQGLSRRPTIHWTWSFRARDSSRSGFLRARWLTPVRGAFNSIRTATW